MFGESQSGLNFLGILTVGTLKEKVLGLLFFSVFLYRSLHLLNF